MTSVAVVGNLTLSMLVYRATQYSFGTGCAPEGLKLFIAAK